MSAASPLAAMRVASDPTVRLEHLVAVRQVYSEGIDPSSNQAALGAAMREAEQERRQRALDRYDPAKLRLESTAVQLAIDLSIVVQDEGDPKKIRHMLKALNRNDIEAVLVAALYAMPLDTPAAAAHLWPASEPQAA